jgi:PAS domain S-box-containing protein
MDASQQIVNLIVILAGLLAVGTSIALRSKVKAKTSELSRKNTELLTEIAEHKRADAVRTVLYNISRAANTAHKLSEFLKTVHEQLGTLIDATNFYVALYDAKTDEYAFPYCVDEREELVEFSAEQLHKSLTDYVRRTGCSLLADDKVHLELIGRGQVGLVGIPSPIWLGVPLKTAQSTIGVVVVQSYTDPAAYTEDDLALLEFVSSQVAGAIERVRSEEELRAERDFSTSLIESSPVFFVALDFDGSILMMNNSMLQALGYDLNEIVGRDYLRSFVPEREHEMVGEIFAKLEGGKSPFNRNHILTKDGQELLVEWHGKPVSKSGEEIDFFFGIGIDITERAKLEERLHQAKKLEAIGQLAGGIAHDFNNLLTVINGYSEFALEALGPEAPLRQDIEEIHIAGERAADLTYQLLAFSRQQLRRTEILNLNTVIEGMSNSLQSSIGENISLELRLQEELGLVKADPGQIEQVVLNLATNACDAMPNGGTLTIETANVVLDETSAVGTLGTMTGPHVTLTVTDSGTGIPSDIIEHVFEPFFTTKEVGKGTGLGLAAVYGIVKQGGGDIHLYSEPGLGTSFRIYLPQANGDPAGLDTIEFTGALPRGRETVLIIENLDNVRTLATRVLTDLGYTVLVAQHGADALHMCQSEHAPIDLVLTDVIMPEMSGPEIIERLHQILPAFKVLYMSGYTDSEMAVRGILEPGARFLQKPFTGKMLADKVRQELDRRAHAEDIIESSSHKA